MPAMIRFVLHTQFSSITPPPGLDMFCDFFEFIKLTMHMVYHEQEQ